MFKLLLAALLAGCATAPPEPPPAAHAQDALCPEHGVLESVCTRCNERLVPVFQAKGDWCEAHAFPESFCPVCWPERGGRPQVTDLSIDDGAPADGTLVRFKTRDTAQRAGLETSEVRSAEWTGGVEAIAQVRYDATRVAAVSAVVPGLVHRVLVEIGDPVPLGAPLAELRSSAVADARQRAAVYRRHVELAEGHLSRQRALHSSGAGSTEEIFDAERALGDARAELGEVEALLHQVGPGEGDRYLVRSPLAGVLTERLTAVGSRVDGDTPLFQVLDPSWMWAELHLADLDLGAVRLHQPVALQFDALPGRTYLATLDYLAPQVDPQTRTALARVRLDNADGQLRAGLYGHARVQVGEAEPSLLVPDVAVQRAGPAYLVFVRESDDSYVARRVRVLDRHDGTARVSGALQVGQQVVTTGAFLLKTETLKDSIGAGCCDVE